MSNPSFINKSACRKFLLDKAMERWPTGKMTRVSADIFEFLEASIRTNMLHLISNHPSVGKTITTGRKKENGTGTDE